MTNPLGVIDRLVMATNAHDLDALLACFDDDYVNETPAHPLRGFRGGSRCDRTGRHSLPGCPTSRCG